VNINTNCFNCIIKNLNSKGSPGRALTASSLSSAEGSPDFEVIVNLSSLCFCSEGHVGSLSLLSHDLHIDVGEVIEVKSLALLFVKNCLSFINNLLHSVGNCLSLRVFIGVVDCPQELVVLLVYTKLDWMLVVGEERIVPVGQVGHGSSLNDYKS